MNKLTTLLYGAALLGFTGLLFAWGSKPHADIVNAALSVIPPEDRLLQRLGEDGPRLSIFVQMGDWNDCFVQMPGRWTVSGADFSSPPQSFYANDYLIFPALPQLNQHMLPAVKATYVPLFDRALQALRTETPANAARWVGSLLHFVTDSGSPPHTANILGEIHTRMENWVDASRMVIRGYTPQLLGKTDDEARQAFLERMDGLAAFSRLRAGRLTKLVEAADRTASEPVIMESATETAHVAADVIHTLLQLSVHKEPGTTLEAEVIAPETTGLPALPAKLVLLGTAFGTLSETLTIHDGFYSGRFFLEGIPAGKYTAAISRPGCRLLRLPGLTLDGRTTTHFRWTLDPDLVSGNRLRNPDFQLRWVNAQHPDGWRFDARRKQWISDNVIVTAQKTYAFAVSSTVPQEVMVEWMAEHWRAAGPPVEVPASMAAPAGVRYARILINGAADPGTRIHEISIRELE